MKKKLPLSFTYEEVEKIFEITRNRIYNLVGNEYSEKPLKKVGVKSGFRPTITSESVVKLFMRKYGVDESEAVKEIQRRLHPEEPSKEKRVEDVKAKDPAGKAVEATDAPELSSDTSVTPEEPDETPAADIVETPSDDKSSEDSIIYIADSLVDGSNKKSSPKQIKQSPARKAETSYTTWMYTIPFFDKNPEFGIQPKTIGRNPSDKELVERLNFIADSFEKKVKGVKSVLVTLCSSEGGYLHLHAIVMYHYGLKKITARNNFGDSAHVDPVDRKELRPDGSVVYHNDPVQGAVQYIMKNGRFEGRTNEAVLLPPEIRGTAIIEAAKAEKKSVASRKPRKAEAVIAAAKAGESRASILSEHPTYINPSGIETIRFTQQYEAWKSMGYPKTRPVRVMLVLGDVRTGKTQSIIETMSTTKLGMSTFSETSSLEAYEAQPVLLVDHPHPRWCPADLTEKLLSSNIVQLPVRKEGAVLSLWQWVFVETKSIRNLESNYGATAVKDILKYVDKIRFCFVVETRKLAPTLFQDGYAREATEGVNTRLDYIDIPVNRGVFRTRLGEQEVDDNLVKGIARMYFDVTKIDGEKAPELEGVEKTTEYVEITNKVFWYLRKEIVAFGREDVIPAIMEICKRQSMKDKPVLPKGWFPSDGPDL